MLIKIILGFIYSLFIVISTFTIIKLPFFSNSDILPNIYNMEIISENHGFIFGIYSSNLQLFMLIFLSLIFNPSIIFISQLVYITIGFIGIPIFYNGGGYEYLSHPYFGYLIVSFISALVISFLVHSLRKRESNTKYSIYSINLNYLFLISLVGLFIIQFGGSFTLSMNLNISWYKILQNSILVMLPSQIVILTFISIFAFFINYIKIIIPNIFYIKRRTERNNHKKTQISENFVYRENFST